MEMYIVVNDGVREYLEIETSRVDQRPFCITDHHHILKPNVFRSLTARLFSLLTSIISRSPPVVRYIRTRTL
jgi:hypothetical protein